MRKLLFTALCALATLTASAQGTLTFLNPTAPVSNADDGSLLGAGFTAQLLRDGTAVASADFINAGIFSGGTVTLENASGAVDLSVYVSNADGTITGTSPVFSQPLGDASGTPPTPPGALAMPSFTVSAIPEPSHVILALLGGAALLFARRRK